MESKAQVANLHKLKALSRQSFCLKRYKKLEHSLILLEKSLQETSCLSEEDREECNQLLTQLRQIINSYPQRFASTSKQVVFWLGVQKGKIQARTTLNALNSPLSKPVWSEDTSAEALGCSVGWCYAQLKQKLLPQVQPMTHFG